MPRKPTRKAANGQGSTRWNEARKRYEHRMVTGYKPDGSPIRRMVTGRTQEELAAKLKDLRDVVQIDPTLPVGITVGEFLTYWLDNVLPLANVSQATRESYAYNVRLYINPYVGRVPLSQLAPVHVRTMLKALADVGKSTNTQRLARATLRRALRTAETDGLVTRNVAALVDGVRQTHREGRTLSLQQAQTLMHHIKGHDLEAAVLVMLTLGLRRGEVAGLTWDDVTLPAEGSDGGKLRVVRAVKKADDGSTYVGSTKTARPRSLPISGQLVDALRRHRARQSADRLKFGAGWGAMFPEYQFVFTNRVGSPIDLDKLNRNLKVLTTSAGLGSWSPHELRHSAISLMIANGAKPRFVQEIAGHASGRITNDIYTHVIEGGLQETADIMTSALWGSAQP